MKKKKKKKGNYEAFCNSKDSRSKYARIMICLAKCKFNINIDIFILSKLPAGLLVKLTL